MGEEIRILGTGVQSETEIFSEGRDRPLSQEKSAEVQSLEISIPACVENIPGQKESLLSSPVDLEKEFSVMYDVRWNGMEVENSRMREPVRGIRPADDSVLVKEDSPVDGKQNRIRIRFA